MKQTVGDIFADELKSHGVKRIFGIPGGGSSVDFIDACMTRDIKFELVQQESSAAIMAVVSGEITSSIGSCISIMGPGATNLASGASYAFLERHPLLVFTECYGLPLSSHMTMQKIDHQSLFSTVSKGSKILDENQTKSLIRDAIKISKDERPGPYHLDIPNNLIFKEYLGDTENFQEDKFSESDFSSIDRIAETIDKSDFPLVILGPLVHRENLSDSIKKMLEKSGIAFMVTSKARGVISEDDPFYAGIVSGVYSENTFEDSMISKSDLIIGIGFDRSELLSPWKHQQPYIELDSIYIPEEEKVTEPYLNAFGDLEKIIKNITDQIKNRQCWSKDDLKKFWAETRFLLGVGTEEFNPGSVIGLSREMTPNKTIISTEAGVYGRVGLYAWKVENKNTYYDSSGANTMGFSIPAIIAASLEISDQKSVAFVGDGGFMMKVSELETIARLGLKPVILVFNDGTLGMIRIKQSQKGLPRAGVDLYQPDLVKIAQSFGGEGYIVNDLISFKYAFDKALENDKFTIIDLRFDPDVYASPIKLIRG